MTYQWDSLKLAMSGNLIENNIIVTGSSSGGSGYSDDGTPTAPTIKKSSPRLARPLLAARLLSLRRRRRVWLPALGTSKPACSSAPLALPRVAAIAARMWK
jgi:hypothetical protein